MQLFWTINIIALICCALACRLIGVKETYYKIKSTWSFYMYKVDLALMIFYAIISIIIIECWLWIYNWGTM